MLAGVPVRAQDGGQSPCADQDIAEALQTAIANLQAAQGLDVEQALSTVNAVQAQLNFLKTRCTVTTSADGTRTNPIPLGEYYQFDKGKVRITAIQDPYPNTEGLYGPDSGMRAIAISVEYVCEESDPNRTCSTSDAFPTSVILAGGEITDLSMIFSSQDEPPSFSGQEAFAGNTLAGVDYLAVPEGQQIEGIRLMVGFEYIYFSPTPLSTEG